MLSFALNFCLTFAMIWTAGILFFISVAKTNSAPQSCVLPPASDKSGIIELSAEDKGVERAVSIEVNDAGFLTKGVQVRANDTVNFTVLNSGSNPHSFVIGDLGVNTGLISPGGTGTATASGLKEQMYIFSSDAGDDKKNGFGGIMMVLE